MDSWTVLTEDTDVVDHSYGIKDSQLCSYTKNNVCLPSLYIVFTRVDFKSRTDFFGQERTNSP